MGRTWLYAGASLAVFAGTFFQVYFRSPTLDALGVYRTLQPINHNNCKNIPELQACEKITILSSGIIYLACAGTIESRTTWMPTLDALNETAVLTRSIPDYLATYDIHSGAVTKLNVVGLTDPRGLNLHGMDVVPDETDPTALWIYLVNHRPQVDSAQRGANSVIEILKTRKGAGYAEWVQTVQDARVMVTPNDIVGGGNGKEFWFTNDNGAKVGWASDGSIVVGSYRVDLPLDNLVLSADGSIIAAAFPKLHLLGETMRNVSMTAPSAVLRISDATLDGKYNVEKIYEDDGQLGSFATTAAMHGDTLYIHVVGIGLFFSAFMLCLTWIQARYTGFSPSNSEEFSSASRSVKPGLIASGIVSAWTWAATLLQSSAVAYKYGISGPWWYGAGATIQVLLFAMLAAKLKLNSPNAHTFLEIIGARWGTAAHLIFLFFGLATNIIVSSMLILGGSATVTDLTGMNTIAACFLIPIGVAIYVVAGGMRATLLCDYTHTAVLFAIILTFIFTAYATSPKIGSPARMHELLVEAAMSKPVSGNAQGSYLTMRSKNGLIFGVINIIGNFATVFNDQAYWQRAIASKPQSCVKAYLLGGLAWFSIPFTFATTLGLAAVALHNDPDMRSLSPADVSAGLPAPSAAAALLGTSGAAAMLILLFLAVTSATSAELIAVSSLLTYDVYKRYINPRATE
ncbi:unnamed protein product, partial [Rhizoctonia solani]